MLHILIRRGGGCTSNCKISPVLMENHRFSGAIIHYLCVFNREFPPKLAVILQFAVPAAPQGAVIGGGTTRTTLSTRPFRNSSFLIQIPSFLIQNSSFLIQIPSFLIQNSSLLGRYRCSRLPAERCPAEGSTRRHPGACCPWRCVVTKNDRFILKMITFLLTK